MGEVFAGRYELLDPVATGGMGTIWRVLDRSDGQLRAAKILRQSDAASLLRFVREQSVRIDHTHVVTPLSWAGVDDRVLFTMPLVHGGSVADLLRDRGALPARWVALLTDQLLQALEAVHAAGIVHRDVKPGNLLLEPTGTGTPHLRLTDFGIAVPVDEPRMTRGTQAIGTPGYMPPEQWRGADPHPTADLYAVGRVALEMLLGRRLTDADTREATEALLRHDGSAHDRLVRLVLDATRDDPADRPADAGAMRAALAELVALPPTPDEPEVRVPDRFPASTVPEGPPTRASTAAPTVLGPVETSPTRLGSSAAAVPVPSAVPGLVLLLVGLLGLVVAGWLLLS